MLKPKAQVKSDEDSLFVDNMLDTYYPSRPDQLENFSLYNLATNFEITSKKGESYPLQSVNRT